MRLPSGPGPRLGGLHRTPSWKRLGHTPIHPLHFLSRIDVLASTSIIHLPPSYAPVHNSVGLHEKVSRDVNWPCEPSEQSLLHPMGSRVYSSL